MPHPPSAVIGLNDRIAIGAMKAILEGGLKVPEQVSIVGFDNLDVSAWTTPTVTTIDQQVELLMSTAASVLLQQIRDPEAEKLQTQLIRPVLKNRMST
ncbi:substrate-binding domain-containing protein, partial [Arthrospira platensis SPKY1]|nr:substrate-binding domain-containing protein [Arthrospira platensis SPKY1]